jgi:HSP20 family molecular chaperone IbpA
MPKAKKNIDAPKPKSGKTVKPAGEIVAQKGTVVEKTGESEGIWYRIRPNFSSHFDYTTGEFTCEVQLPGVPKDRVKLRISPELFDLKGTCEHALYTLTEYFPVKVNVDTLDAQYNNGLLRMKVQFLDPLAKAVEIVLQD